MTPSLHLFTRGLLALSFALGGSASAQQIAFTWDDLPAHSALPAGETRLRIATGILAAMKAHHMPPAYGFVNGIRLEQEPGSDAVLTAWRNAGFPLGNHTWSHINLNQNSADAFMADTTRNESLLQKDMPVSNYRWLRYPYLAEGETGVKRTDVRNRLARAGYRVAAVTLSFSDYAWNEPYARCLNQANTAAISSLEAGYLKAADDSLTRARTMSRALAAVQSNKPAGPADSPAGQEIPYVLLMHVGAFDARMLPRLLALYEQRGVTFVSLEQAESDSFYREAIDLTLPSTQPTTLEGALAAHHLSVPPPLAEPDFSLVCR